MGGKEASRGFLYQAFAAILEALCDEKWDKIYVEYASNDDKVDIALEENGKISKSIQVKSTINSFSKTSIINWLKALIKDDVGATEFQLCLIGQCDKDAIVFINSIEKFQSDSLDDKARTSLKEFDTDIIKDKKITFKNLNYDVSSLEAIVRDSLAKYVSYKGISLTFEQTDIIAKANVYEQMLYSTHGNGIDRKTFDENLQKHIFLVAKNQTSKRISIGIKSFKEKAFALENNSNCLSLIDKFNERKIKDEYDWNEDIYKKVKSFLITNTSSEEKYQIYLDTHATIAFAAGRVLDSKSGIDIFPVQKTSTEGMKLWNINLSSEKSYAGWSVCTEVLNDNEHNTAIVFNISHDIKNNVIEYIKDNNLSIGRVYNCKIEGVKATIGAVEDGTHAWELASSVYDILSRRTSCERQSTLHIFASAPNGFMFLLGKNSRMFGECLLYEYDSKTGLYSPSIKFID